VLEVRKRFMGSSIEAAREHASGVCHLVDLDGLERAFTLVLWLDAAAGIA
jgi:hypothetical protein